VVLERQAEQVHLGDVAFTFHRHAVAVWKFVGIRWDRMLLDDWNGRLFA
jgi:hypothetical protein